MTSSFCGEKGRSGDSTKIIFIFESPLLPFYSSDKKCHPERSEGSPVFSEGLEITLKAGYSAPSELLFVCMDPWLALPGLLVFNAFGIILYLNESSPS
jgi:hypothetical protein